jgi:hypothetical protein
MVWNSLETASDLKIAFGGAKKYHKIPQKASRLCVLLLVAAVSTDEAGRSL